MKIAIYKWGNFERESTVDEEMGMTEQEFDDYSEELMKLNEHHLAGFDVKHTGTFYADPTDVDVDEEGVSVSYAYCVIDSDEKGEKKQSGTKDFLKQPLSQRKYLKIK